MLQELLINIHGILLSDVTEYLRYELICYHLFKYNIRDSYCVVIEFTSTSAISTLHTKVVRIWGVLETTSCDKVCQRLVASLLMFPHQ